MRSTRAGQGDGSYVLTRNTSDAILASGVLLCREVRAGKAAAVYIRMLNQRAEVAKPPQPK